MQKIKILCLVVFITQLVVVYAQEPSLYSRYGLGIPLENNFAPSAQIGGLNAAYRHAEGVNYNNPASYTENAVTSLEAGFTGVAKFIKNSDTKQRLGGFQNSYLAVSYPVNKYWAMSAGLVPLFHKEYIIRDTVILNDEYKIRKEYDGIGNIYNFYWGNGFKYKGASVGFNIGYMFGKISNYNLAYTLDDNFIDNNAYATFVNTDLRVKSFTYNLGAQYEVKINADSMAFKQGKKPLYITLGISGYPRYKLGKQSTIDDKVLSIDNFLLTYRGNNQDLEDFNKEVLNINSAYIDTFSYLQDKKVRVEVPGKINIGAMFSDKQHYKAGIDFGYQPWSRYSGYEDNDASVLFNSFRIGMGGEYLPTMGSNKGIFKRLKYRTGFYYSKTNITIHDTPIKEFGINFGLGIPVLMQIPDENGFMQRTSVYAFHVGVEAGSRGTTQHQLIKENFVRVNFGFNFNDRWFIRRKFL